MKDYENESRFPEEEDKLPAESGNESKPEPTEDKASAQSPETPEAPEAPERPEAAAPRDIYGRPYQNMQNEPRMHYEQSEPPKKKKSEVKMSGGALALLLVCCMLVSILAGAGINYVFDGPGTTTAAGIPGTTTASPVAGETTTAGGGETIAPNPSTGETAPSISIGGGSVIGNTDFPEGEIYATVANECVKSVVIIRVTETVLSYGQEYESQGAGSGVIYDKNGYIVTNYHVVGESTTAISVELYDGSVYEGKYIYGDEYADLAVIKIEKNDCHAAVIGDSSKMALGQMVVAIGNPLGYGLSVTPGVISALQRSVTIENTTMLLMQTSAAINSGNSGGGLFNLKGELVGIVNAKVGGTSVEGMGFAIPSTTVVKSLNDLKEYGYITGKARLGVTVQTKQYQTWPYMQTYSYIQVAEVDPDGSAAASGLKVGDILYKFNDKEITAFEVLSEQLTRYAVGDTVTLTVKRPTIEYTGSNLSEYLGTCEEIELVVTFVEFNPNA